MLARVPRGEASLLPVRDVGVGQDLDEAGLFSEVDEGVQPQFEKEPEIVHEVEFEGLVPGGGNVSAALASADSGRRLASKKATEALTLLGSLSSVCV